MRRDLVVGQLWGGVAPGCASRLLRWWLVHRCQAGGEQAGVVWLLQLDALHRAGQQAGLLQLQPVLVRVGLQQLADGLAGLGALVQAGTPAAQQHQGRGCAAWESLPFLWAAAIEQLQEEH